MNQSEFEQSSDHQLAQRFQEAFAAPAETELGTSKDTPSFPLARNAKLPESFEFQNGHLGIKFGSFACELGDSVVVSNVNRMAHQTRFSLGVPHVSVRGRYAVDAEFAPIIDIDTAGSLLPFDHQTGGSTDGVDPTFDESQQSAYLDQARNQRTKLREKPNGQKLMTTFEAHNEVFHELFQKDAQLRDGWKAGGATADMAKDTSTAIDADEKEENAGGTEDAVINSPTKTYGSGTNSGTYNQQSFVQKVNVVAACINNSGYNPWTGGKMPDNKFTQAALSTLNFEKVVDTTGNSKSKAKPMKAGEVFNSVDTFDGPEPETTLDELQNQAGQSMGNGGAIELAEEKGWAVLDEEDRSHFRLLLENGLRQRMASEQQEKQVLWSGAISTELFDLELDLTLSWDPAGALEQVAVAIPNLPSFELKLQDDHWEGEAADLIRDRLSRVQFINSLLKDQTESVIIASVVSAVKRLAS